MEKEQKDFIDKKHTKNDKKEEDEAMPRVRGHYRRVSRTRRVRVRSHRRRLPTTRRRLRR